MYAKSKNYQSNHWSAERTKQTLKSNERTKPKETIEISKVLQMRQIEENSSTMRMYLCCMCIRMGIGDRIKLVWIWRGKLGGRFINILMIRYRKKWLEN